MAKMYQQTRRCKRCRKLYQWYYDSDMNICVECKKKAARKYSMSKKGRQADRDRRRGVRGREYYQGRLEKEGRREVLERAQKEWREKNEEKDRFRRMVLARIHYRIRTGKIEQGCECEKCGVGGQMYVYVNWRRYKGGAWIPNFKWLCSLCLGVKRQRDTV